MSYHKNENGERNLSVLKARVTTLYKEHSDLIVQAAKSAAGEFAPHQKAIATLLPRLQKAQKGENIEFSDAEKAQLQSAAKAGEKLLALSTIFPAAITEQLKTMIGLAKAANSTSQKGDFSPPPIDWGAIKGKFNEYAYHWQSSSKTALKSVTDALLEDNTQDQHESIIIVGLFVNMLRMYLTGTGDTYTSERAVERLFNFMAPHIKSKVSIAGLGEIFGKSIDSVTHPEQLHFLFEEFKCILSEKYGSGLTEAIVTQAIADYWAKMPKPQDIKQAAISTWINSANDTSDIDSFSDMKAGYLYMQINVVPKTFGHGYMPIPGAKETSFVWRKLFFDDVTRAYGNKAVLADVFGANADLFNLPFDMELYITADPRQKHGYLKSDVKAVKKAGSKAWEVKSGSEKMLLDYLKFLGKNPSMIPKVKDLMAD